MKATISSITFMKSEKGTTASPNAAFSNMKIKDTKLNKMIWPAVIFANKRTINENGFINTPTISTGVKIINIHLGTPGIAKMCVQYVERPFTLVTMNAMIAKTKVTAIFPVTFAPPGIKPNILLNQIKKKIVNK